MAELIKQDGTRIRIDPPSGKKALTLKQMQKAVGGWIEVVPRFRQGNIHLICNEEGRVLDLLPNLEATRIFNGLDSVDELTPSILDDPMRVLVGDVLVLQLDELV